ncbi:MAG TPA: hypothetical protein VKM94_15250 [Blastocatellia bacterium]|nr:hypothetical protein [Blastocatellia bacterium]
MIIRRTRITIETERVVLKLDSGSNALLPQTQEASFEPTPFEPIPDTSPTSKQSDGKAGRREDSAEY